MSKVEERLKQMGYSLPPAGGSGKLESGVRVENLLFTSGVASMTRGKLGQDLGVEEGYEAARECGLQLLANVKALIGDLDKVNKVVKVLAMINCTPDFKDQPAVAHGFTDLFIQVFGEEVGRHARSAVGMVGLPGGKAVEIEMVVDVAR